MAILRSLRLTGMGLTALLIICVFVLPEGIVPMAVSLALAGLTALDMLVILILALLRDHSMRGFVQCLVALSVLLIILGGVGSQMYASSYEVVLTEGEEIALSGRGMDGYTLALEDAVPKNLANDGLALALTRPDQVTIHETATLEKPFVYDGIELHPLLAKDGEAQLLVHADAFRYLIGLGAILFLVGLGLSAVPRVRKRGEA